MKEDDAPAAPATPDNPQEPTAPSGAATPSASSEEAERQHQGREAMDRWMLHRSLMEDLADELAANDPPATLLPAPTNETSPHPLPVTEE